jgi:4-amino-4-deoxy-L-arabinose transferase-like glycosyltransferase
MGARGLAKCHLILKVVIFEHLFGGVHVSHRLDSKSGAKLTMHQAARPMLHAPRSTPYLISLIFLLYFWANGLSNLDRFPLIHEDESWQAAPGYTFWAEGRFGTDLFAGFFGMEKHYYGFMPLFPIMVGAALHLFGLGLFQARLVPLILITLTLTLTHRLGTKLFTPWHGALAVVVLVTWRIAGPFPHLVSGIPMVDIARIVRYDSAVPIFGLSALLLLVTALRQHATFHHSSARLSFFAIGLLTGLATLSHLYGIFWLPALLLPTFGILRWRAALRPALVSGAGFGLVLMPWLIFVASGWNDFLNQTRNYAARFGLFQVRFYLVNILTEVERYDPILNGAKQAFGSWLWLIVGGLSYIWLLRRSLARRASSSQASIPDKTKMSGQVLVGSLSTMMALFAVLLTFKTFTYLGTLWPLFAIVLAAGFIHVWHARTTHRWWRPLLVLLFGLALVEGMLTGWYTQRLAQRTTPYQTFTQAIADQLPPNSRLMGLQHYWLGLVDESQDYRSILVPIFWTNPEYVRHPVSFSQATQTVSPQFILLDQIMLDFLAETADPDHNYHTLGLEMQAFLAQPEVRLIAELDDPSYHHLRIYQLDTGP